MQWLGNAAQNKTNTNEESFSQEIALLSLEIGV
jgi:hypothetical protein